MFRQGLFSVRIVERRCSPRARVVAMLWSAAGQIARVAEQNCRHRLAVLLNEAPSGTENCGAAPARREHFPSQEIPGRMQTEYEEAPVPYVQVTWVEGRTPEQKRKLAERITQVLVEDGRAKRENIQVTFVDLPATDYAEAGVTVADQKRPPTP